LLNQIAAIHGTGVAASTTSYESIATVTVGSGGSSSISFTSIPSTYKHLQIRGLGRDSTSNNAYLLIRFNSDSGANYARHWLTGSGASATANGFADTTEIGAPYSLPSTASNTFGASIIDILDYTNTNKYKTVKSFAGWDANGSGYITLSSGFWRNTNAITSITLTNESTFAQYSQFALYGIRG